MKDNHRNKGESRKNRRMLLAFAVPLFGLRFKAGAQAVVVDNLYGFRFAIESDRGAVVKLKNLDAPIPRGSVLLVEPPSWPDTTKSIDLLIAASEGARYDEDIKNEIHTLHFALGVNRNPEDVLLALSEILQKTHDLASSRNMRDGGSLIRRVNDCRLHLMHTALEAAAGSSIIGQWAYAIHRRNAQVFSDVN